MCGIIGYTGYDRCKDILIKGLKSLEYRGYDSAGAAVYNHKLREFTVTKCTGRVSRLQGILDCGDSRIGLGHTRWATHGEVSDINSHPHKFGRVTVVHNGIIENYDFIKKLPYINGRLQSQTDSEAAAALIDMYYGSDNDPVKAIASACRGLEGTFALGIVFDDIPDKIFAVRNFSPIVCCLSDRGGFIASDITAFNGYGDEYFVLSENAVAQISANEINVTDFNGAVIKPELIPLDKDAKNDGKCGYPFFMEKEICQQPEVIKKIIDLRLNCEIPDFSYDGLAEDYFDRFRNISVVACGTAMHSGLIGKHLIEKICKIPVNVYVASEFVCSNPVIDDKTLVICVSQSGETADTLAALKYAKSLNCSILSVVNVRESSIARESDSVIYTDAGSEIAVASTKAYTSQVTIFYLITAYIAFRKKIFTKMQLDEFIDNLKKIPDAVGCVINSKNEIHKLASSFTSADNAFMIGRGLDYPVLLEGSLKLKEISYIHSEAFASGELKHGTIALITKDTPVIALVTQACLASKQLSNIREVQSRGGKIIAVVKEGIDFPDFKDCFRLPDIPDDFSAIPAAVSLQLIAYYVSADKGLDVDKPRNLAKVVTVE